MNTEDIAKIAHEVNRAYCDALGDFSQPKWESAPDWQRKSAIAGVEYHMRNKDLTPRQSHQVWLDFKQEHGWTYGEKKDAAAKTHPYLKPYDELTEAQRAKDYLFGTMVSQLLDYAEHHKNTKGTGNYRA